MYRFLTLVCVVLLLSSFCFAQPRLSPMAWRNVAIDIEWLANDSAGYGTNALDGWAYFYDGTGYPTALDWRPGLNPTFPVDSAETTVFGWYIKMFILFKTPSGAPESIYALCGPNIEDSCWCHGSETLLAWHGMGPFQIWRPFPDLGPNLLSMSIPIGNFAFPGTRRHFTGGVKIAEDFYVNNGAIVYDSMYIFIEDRYGKYNGHSGKYAGNDPWCPTAGVGQSWSWDTAFGASGPPGDIILIKNPEDTWAPFPPDPPYGVNYLQYPNDTCIAADVRETQTKPPRYPVLYENSPNPFNAATDIKFSLPEPAYVKLAVTDVLGKHVITLVDEQKSAGTHTVRWNATDEKQEPVPSGVYFYELTVGDWSAKRKMTLVK